MKLRYASLAAVFAVLSPAARAAELAPELGFAAVAPEAHLAAVNFVNSPEAASLPIDLLTALKGASLDPAKADLLIPVAQALAKAQGSALTAADVVAEAVRIAAAKKDELVARSAQASDWMSLQATAGAMDRYAERYKDYFYANPGELRALKERATAAWARAGELREGVADGARRTAQQLNPQAAAGEGAAANAASPAAQPGVGLSVVEALSETLKDTDDEDQRVKQARRLRDAALKYPQDGAAHEKIAETLVWALKESGDYDNDRTLVELMKEALEKSPSVLAQKTAVDALIEHVESLDDFDYAEHDVKAIEALALASRDKALLETAKKTLLKEYENNRGEDYADLARAAARRIADVLQPPVQPTTKGGAVVEALAGVLRDSDYDDVDDVVKAAGTLRGAAGKYADQDAHAIAQRALFEAVYELARANSWDAPRPLLEPLQSLGEQTEHADVRAEIIAKLTEAAKDSDDSDFTPEAYRAAARVLAKASKEEKTAWLGGIARMVLSGDSQYEETLREIYNAQAPEVGLPTLAKRVVVAPPAPRVEPAAAQPSESAVPRGWKIFFWTIGALMSALIAALIFLR